MAYTKQTWDSNSIFNPTRMNHIEDGIYECSEPTTESGSATFDCGVGENSFCKYVKRGKLVYVTYAFTITSAVSATQSIINSLPKAALNADAFNWIGIISDTDGTSRRALLENSNDYLTIKNNYGRGLVQNGVYLGSFCYIAE